jgi:hypothetical protein
MFLSRSSPDGIMLFNYNIFERIVGSVHLLLPATTMRLLSVFDKYALYCDEEQTAQFLRKLPCDGLITLLRIEDPLLAEAALNIPCRLKARKSVFGSSIASGMQCKCRYRNLQNMRAADVMNSVSGTF